MDVYNQALGNPPFFDIHILIKSSVFVFFILLTLVEIMIYFVFFLGQGKAKFNFQAQTPMELSLVKGEIIVLTRRIDGNW